MSSLAKLPAFTLALSLAWSALLPVDTAAQETRAAEIEAERARRAAATTSYRPGWLERALYAIEDDLLFEKWLNAPRGPFVRLGGIGEGAGFGVGPALRLNAPRYDFRTSAAVSTKGYVVAESALRWPGTLGHNEYLRPDGPFVEVQGRYRDLPQEDFFGLGSESLYSARSSYRLQETLGRGTVGIARRRVETGLQLGHLGYQIGPGTDKAMPSSTDTFSAAAVPGLSGRPSFVTLGGYMDFRTRDRAVNKQDGGEYRATWTFMRDQSSARHSFSRWDVDLRQFIGFGKRTRTIALRSWAAGATPLAGHSVPFYLQPWLGGAQTIRGYRTFRFRDRSVVLLQAEYRWRINELMSGALFYDTGGVGRSLGQIDRLDRGYGGGIRVGGRMGSMFRIDVATGGRDGYRLLVRFDDAF